MNQTVAGAAKPKTSKMAVTSMIMGILSIFIGWLTLAILPIIAIILGHKAQGKIKRSEGMLTGSGAAIAGYVTGYISLGLLIPMLGIIAAITIPAYNDFTARARVMQIHSATVPYRNTIGQELVKSTEPGTLLTDPTALGLRPINSDTSIYIEKGEHDSNGVITLTLNRRSSLPIGNGMTIVYVPEINNGTVYWRIDRERSTVPYRFLRRLQ